MKKCSGCEKKYSLSSVHLECINCKEVFYESCIKQIARCKNPKCNNILCLHCWGKLQECHNCHSFILKRIIRMTMDIESRMDKIEKKS